MKFHKRCKVAHECAEPQKHSHKHTLTVPFSPGVLAAARAERIRGSRDVQVLDQMTEPADEAVGRLTALPQKLMQRHESRLLVSRTQNKLCHPERPLTAPAKLRCTL